MYELLLRAGFSAAHQLRMHDGTTEPLHGHNWRVEILLRGRELDSIGILADFTTLHSRLRSIADGLNDTFLNELPVLSSDNPSTERVAKYIHDAFSQDLPRSVRIARVRVWETPDCAAAYLPDVLDPPEVVGNDARGLD